MRLTEDQVRQGLQHADKDVRFAALHYFASSYSPNTSIMPEVIELIERLGPYGAFTYCSQISDLAQTDETIKWAIGRLQHLPENEEEQDFAFHLGRLLLKAEPTQVIPHREAILASPGFGPELASQLELRLRLVSTLSDQLWQRLEAICEAGKGKPYPDDIPFAEASELAEALARDASQAERMMELLGQEVDPDVDSLMLWLEIFVVQMAGHMRYEPAIPLLVEKLCIDGELLDDDCVRALTRIGTDAVIQAVREVYASSDATDQFQHFSATLFGDIHSDLALSAGLELLGSELDDEPNQRVWLAIAVVGQLATEAIDAGRLVLLECEPRFTDLKHGLVAACKLLNYDVPELQQWEEELALRRRQFTPRAFPLFDGIDDLGEELDDPGDLDEPEPEPVAPRAKVGRNDPCPCGSGKKYKKCCLNASKTSQLDDLVPKDW